MKTDHGLRLRASRVVLPMARGDLSCIRLDVVDADPADQDDATNVDASVVDDTHVVVSLHGGHVVSWHAQGRERLFLSALAESRDGQAIRGGIPVIFPQFAARGPLVKHGFARTMAWTFEGIAEDGTSAAFLLRDDDATRAQWPQNFSLRLRVSFDRTSLSVTLEVANTGTQDFDFSCALHNYLHVHALAQVELNGVAGASYLDSTRGGAAAVENNGPLRFGAEIDRIHVGSHGAKTLHDGNDTLAITMQGFTDTVVWNPGATLAATIGDLAPDDDLHFVCVEAACIEPRIHLAPGATWRGTQRLSVGVPSR